VSKYWNPLLHSIQPYIPGEQPQDKKYIKLNTNENPFPPSPRALEAIRLAAGEDLRLYPDPEGHQLREALASSFNLAPEQVFVGNGSDEVLAFSFLAFFDPRRPILFPDITYSFYPVYADLFKLEYRTVPLAADFSLPVEPFLQNNGGIVFPNPNAPTGRFLSLDRVEFVLKRNPDSVVIIDEAYVAFGGESAVKFIDKYPNLLITNTFSKSHSLAGLRVGYALGNRDLIDGLNRVKGSINSYTLDRLALAGAREALLDREYFEQTRATVMTVREKTAERLVAIGFEVVPSCANFLFVRHRAVLAFDIYRLLKEKGILVRHFNRPRIDNFLRVSIGSDQDMDTFISAVADIVAKPQ